MKKLLMILTLLMATSFVIAGEKQNFFTCLTNASELSTYQGEDAMRIKCFDSFKGQINFSQCLDNASELSTYQGEDSMRVTCFETFRDVITLANVLRMLKK